MSKEKVADARERLAASRRAYEGLRPRVAAGEPWPLAVAFGTEPEASWGPREVLAHVAEMLPYWLGELERIVEGAPGPVPFGRVSEDPVRIGILARDRTLPLRVLFDRIDAGLAAWSARLDTLTPEERAMVGLHPRLGEMSVEQLPEQFVVGHAEGHIQQLEETLAAPRG
jgi:DinB superfamily